MDESPNKTLAERIERLEAVVAELQRRFDSGQAAASTSKPVEAGTPTREAIAAKTVPAASKKRRVGNWLPDGETGLKILGIGLFLLGIVFLFKYSIDQGWVTETVRVGSGLLLGSLLLTIGWRIHGQRRSYSQALLGGAVAAYYITGFAAFQLYQLVPHPVAFGFMVLVTVLALVLGLWQGQPLLSILGAAGGLGTPFLLYNDDGSLTGLVGYTCLVLAGTSAIYLVRGWRSLLWVSVVGGWVVLFVGLDNLLLDMPDTHSNRWALQLGMVCAWLAFWGLPVLREVLTGYNPQRWPRPELGAAAALSPTSIRGAMSRHIHLLSVSTPLVSLLLFAGIWKPSSDILGYFAANCAALFALAALGLRNKPGCRFLAYTQALVGLLLLTIAFCLLLDIETLFLTLAGEAVVVHLISRRLDDRGTAISGHILFCVSALVLMVRLLSMEVEGAPVFNLQALRNLAVIAVGVGLSFVHRHDTEKLVYRLVGHLGLLIWSLRELSALEGGQGYVSIAWGAYAVVLLIVGLRHNFAQLRVAGLGTLLLVVAKLFLVDLAQLEALWRILLFLGFGGVFLILGYYFQALWRGAAEEGGNA
ncbi:MAG: DUF2339 domain-containing protein [Candidatus Latescibacteria bacterium]|nr:DUF2339 domain-containing protein [Candidatus Latescibacterota bacterium]